MGFLKRLFCRHQWAICQKRERYACIGGEQLYIRCRKCGKVKKWIFRAYEGGGYKCVYKEKLARKRRDDGLPNTF